MYNAASKALPLPLPATRGGGGGYSSSRATRTRVLRGRKTVLHADAVDMLEKSNCHVASLALRSMYSRGEHGNVSNLVARRTADDHSQRHV